MDTEHEPKGFEVELEPIEEGETSSSRLLLPIYVIEAFTVASTPFTGNTAAVCILNSDDEISDTTKQNIARNMNLSETAFISRKWKATDKRELPSHSWTLRWFTLEAEVPLCGHATLASAKALFSYILPRISEDEVISNIEFHTKYHATLGARITWTTNLITLNFPSHPPGNPDELIEEESKPEWFGEVIKLILLAKGETPVSAPIVLTPIDIQYSKDAGYLLLRVQNKEELLSVDPDFQNLVKFNPSKLFHGIIVTAESEDEGETSGIHFYSRFFAPWLGVDEDPVTGSAHCVLTPYWKSQYEKKGHKLLTILNGIQLSARRGEVVCELNGNRVNLSGNSRICLRGEFLL